MKRLGSLLAALILCATTAAVAQTADPAKPVALPPPPPPPPPADGATPDVAAPSSEPAPPAPAGESAAPPAGDPPSSGAGTPLPEPSPDLDWHLPPEAERFVAPKGTEAERSWHIVPSARFRAMYLLEEEEFEVEASVRGGTEAVALTLGVVTVGGDPVPLVGVEGFGFFGIDAFDSDGLSGQVLLPDVNVSLAFDRDLILRAGSGLTGFRINRCMGPVSLVGQLRLPIIDVWMVPDDDFEDPLISIGTMLEIGLAL